MPIGSIISAGANLIGGFMGSSDKAKDRKAQKEFAQHGIRWKVEDAKAAGIHPLAALGAQTHSFAPVSVGGPSVASGLSAAGQDISRAIDATRSKGERLDAYAKTVQELNVRRMGLENELLGTQIAKLRQPAQPPGIPNVTDRYLIEGQGDSPLVEDKPLERVTGAPGMPHSEPGSVTDLGYARTRHGWAPVMSKDFQERSEEDFLGGIAWNIRNRLSPSFDTLGGDPPVAVPRNPGEFWIYDPVRQEYRLVKKRGRYGFDRYYR